MQFISKYNPSYRIYILIFLVVISGIVRGLTAYFIREHLADPGWFQSGTYALFDRQAKAILDQNASVFWIDDPAQTETAVYPPGYPAMVAAIYKLSGQRSVVAVQRVQWVLDTFSVLLVFAIGIAAYNYRAGVAAGFLAAVSPLLALSGAVPLADSPTSWLVLAAVWLLMVAAKHQSVFFALLSGILVGLSCWLRGNAILLPLCWVVAWMFWDTSWRKRLSLSTAVAVGMLITTAPLAIRNAVAFQVFTPTGLGVGTNLWEGIGETDRAAEFGAVYGDEKLIEQERVESGVPTDVQFNLYYPNGVERDHARTKRALRVIRAHPLWYAGVILRRMAGVLKFAGTPGRYYGSSGINVTSTKCLPPTLQGGVLSVLVNALGMLQSVMRYLALPLMFIGVVIGLRIDWRVSLVVLSTVSYYLIVGSALHTEFRYGLPMQACLLVFAGLAVSNAIDRVTNLI